MAVASVCGLNMFCVSVAQRMYVDIKMALSRQLRGHTSARGRIYF